MVVALAFLNDCTRDGMLPWSAPFAVARHCGFSGKTRQVQLACRLKRLSEKEPAPPGFHLPPPSHTFARLG